MARKLSPQQRRVLRHIVRHFLLHRTTLEAAGARAIGGLRPSERDAHCVKYVYSSSRRHAERSALSLVGPPHGLLRLLDHGFGDGPIPGYFLPTEAGLAHTDVADLHEEEPIFSGLKTEV